MFRLCLLILVTRWIKNIDRAEDRIIKTGILDIQRMIVKNGTLNDRLILRTYRHPFQRNEYETSGLRQKLHITTNHRSECSIAT